MGNPVPDLSWLADLSRLSMTPEQQVHTNPSSTTNASAGTTKDVGKSNESSTAGEKSKDLGSDSKLKSKQGEKSEVHPGQQFNQQNLVMNAPTVAQPFGIAQSGKISMEGAGIERSRRSRALSRYALVDRLKRAIAEYIEANRGFYGSGAAATTSFCMRCQEILMTGSPGIILAAVLWLSTLILGQELDRIRKLIALQESEQSDAETAVA